MPTTAQLAPYLSIFLIIAVFGLTTSLYTEQSQIIAKIRGAQRNRIAKGYNSAMKIMIFNRFGTILYTFFVALSIDVGCVQRRSHPVCDGSRSLLCFCYNIYLSANARKILLIAQPEDRPFKPWYKTLGQVRRRYAIASYLATLLNILGLTLPLLLSNSFPQFRLSMANTGFLLNTFFTLINVLLLEARVAEVLDKKDSEGAYEFALTIFITRCASDTECHFHLWGSVMVALWPDFFEDLNLSTFSALACKHFKTCVSKDIEYDTQKRASWHQRSYGDRFDPNHSARKDNCYTFCHMRANPWSGLRLDAKQNIRSNRHPANQSRATGGDRWCSRFDGKQGFGSGSDLCAQKHCKFRGLDGSGADTEFKG